MIQGGATIWARQTIESRIFVEKPDKWFKIWFYIVNKVNHMDNGRFKRGSCFVKYEWISESTGASKDQIKHFLEWARGAQMLATQKSTRGMVINVLKYEIYQDLDNYGKQSKSHTEATQKPHRSHTINKNDKNDKNDNINMSEKSDVIVTKSKFDIFWESYPKKELKKKAKEIWKRKGCDESIELILDFVEKAKKTDRWKKGFIKQPTAFLNGECWFDDLSFYGEVQNNITTQKERIVNGIKETFMEGTGWVRQF